MLSLMGLKKKKKKEKKPNEEKTKAQPKKEVCQKIC